MNNKVLYALIGAAVGGVVGYLIADWVAYKLLEQAQAEFDEETADSLATGFRQNSEKAKDIQLLKEKEELKSLLVDYTAASKPASKPEIIMSPYIVNVDVYGRNENNYSRITVMYYVEDNMFCGPDEEVIANPNELFPPNIHLHFGELSEDEDVVYVINHKTWTIYEIIRMVGSYSTEVLGIVPEEKPKNLRQGSARKRGSQAGSVKKANPKAELTDDVDPEPDDSEE